MNTFDGIKQIDGSQFLHPGGHNWPDMQIVVDPSQTEIEDQQIYLIQIKDQKPVVKRCLRKGANQLYLHPALSSFHGQSTVKVFGREMPCQTIEFSDNIYTRYVKVLGKVVGLWAGDEQ